MWVDGGNSGSTGAPNTLAVDRNIANSIILDSEDYPYVAGSVAGQYLFGEQITIVGDSDFFLASLDKDGSEPFWISTTGTPDFDHAMSISVDALGYLNVLGVIGQGVMELPDSDITWNNDTGANDTFVISYDVNGEWYFASFIGGGDKAIGNDIETLANGDFFVVGAFSDSVLFPGETPDGDIILIADTNVEGFIAKYDIDGDILWAKQFGKGPAVDANKVTSDPDGNVFVLGSFKEFIIFEADEDNEVTLVTDSVNDLFIAKYDTDGTFLWAKQIEGTGSQSLDLTQMDEVQPLATQPLDLAYSSFNGGELILSGDFSGTLTMGEFVLNAPESVQSSFVATFAIGTTVNIPTPEVVTEFELIQNYPNPFNPTTTIGFSLNDANDVRIDVYNSVGQRVKTIVNGRYSQGYHQVKFDGTNLSSGMYFYTLRTNAATETKKMILVK